MTVACVRSPLPANNLSDPLIVECSRGVLLRADCAFTDAIAETVGRPTIMRHIEMVLLIMYPVDHNVTTCDFNVTSLASENCNMMYRLS